VKHAPTPASMEFLLHVIEYRYLRIPLFPFPVRHRRQWLL
jgi:hypothetical protein